MLSHYRPIRAVLGAELEPLELVDEVGLVADVVVARGALLCPLLELAPITTFAYLTNRTLGGFGNGSVSRCVVCLTDDVTAQSVEAVGDVHCGE